MRLDVSALKAAGSSASYFFEEAFPPLEFGGESIPFQEPVRLTLTATGTGSSVVLKGKVCTVVELLCGRCLAPISYPVETAYEEEFCPLEHFSPEAREKGAHAFEGDFVELDETVRQSIILALPMRLLCRPD